MKQSRKFHRKAAQAPAATLHKAKLSGKRPSFSTVFASAVGAGTIGSAFGVPGLILGAAIGSGFGLYVNHKHA